MRHRLEVLQDLIDRQLYLPENEKEVFADKLEKLFEEHPLNCTTIRGVRVINR